MCMRSLRLSGLLRTFWSVEQKRLYSQRSERGRRLKRNVVYYCMGTVCLASGLTYASVPLFRKFCSGGGSGGFAEMKKDVDKVETMHKVNKRLLRILFTADTHSQMQWRFKPQQNDIWVYPGETALAFYTGTNPTKRPIVGISTYTIFPYEAGQYFAKIQCFCFEEQILNPGETVDMPVFFYIDPDFVEDPAMEMVMEIHLNYTFFEAKEGLKLPYPLSPYQTQKNVA